MAQQIEWTPSALEDYYNVILYLERCWSQKIADDFTTLTEAKLATLSQQPLIGLQSVKESSVRSILLTKHNRMYYRIEGNKLVVLSVFDTRQDPAKNQY